MAKGSWRREREGTDGGAWGLREEAERRERRREKESTEHGEGAGRWEGEEKPPISPLNPLNNFDPSSDRAVFTSLLSFLSLY